MRFPRLTAIFQSSTEFPILKRIEFVRDLILDLCDLDLCEVPNRPARNQSSSLRSYYSCLLPRFSGLFMSRQKGVHESPRTVAMSDICEKCFSNGCIIFSFYLSQQLSKILYQQTILRNIRTTTVHNKSKSDKE